MTIEQAIAMQEKALKLLGRGKLGEARDLIAKALEIFELIEGKNTPDVANLLNDLADLEDKLGHLDVALKLAERSLAITTALGRKFTGVDAAIIRARANTIMGTVHRERGDYAKAEKFLKQALEINRRALGPAHSEVAGAENNLAVLYKYMGHFAKGLKLYRSALAKYEAEFGEDALPLSTVYHNIGGILHASGRYEEAEAPGRRAWEISRKHLGPNHPHTVADAAAYAGILDELGRYKESEPIYRRALKVFEKLYGPENYEIAINLNNLAALKAAQGKAEEAEEMYRKSIAITEKLLGSKHPDLALAWNNLASLLNETGRKREAIKLYERALKIFEKTLAPNHPKLLLVKENLETTKSSSVPRKS
jgi:tetratricopeptide (TPR) repeat protein